MGPTTRARTRAAWVRTPTTRRTSFSEPGNRRTGPEDHSTRSMVLYFCGLRNLWFSDSIGFSELVNGSVRPRASELQPTVQLLYFGSNRPLVDFGHQLWV